MRKEDIDILDTYGLSPTQHGMLFHAVSGRTGGIDVEQVVCSLEEPVAVETLAEAWHLVAERHDCLRTFFQWADIDTPRQHVVAHVDLPFAVDDLTGIDPAEKESHLQQYLDSDRIRGFDLDTAPLARLRLFKWADDAWTLVWTFHHIVVDGRSQNLILGEVFSIYDAIIHGQDIELDDPLPYRLYIDWLEQQDQDPAKEFWTARLSGFEAPNALPIERPTSPPDDGQQHGVQESQLNAETLAALRDLAEANDVTLNTLVQGAWSVLLHRYSGEQDVVFGTVRACRSWSPSAKSICGLFINTVPFRVNFGSRQDLGPWLRELREQQVSIRDFEHAALSQIQRWSGLSSQGSLFESVLIFDHQSLEFGLRSRGGSWKNRRFRLHENTGYPLTLYLFGEPNLTMQVDYDRTRFDDQAIVRLLGHLQQLLESMSTSPGDHIDQLEMLPKSERQNLLFEWNRTAKDYPTESCIHELIEEQVARTPDKVALVFEDREFTYAELNDRANQVAHRLNSLGVGPETLVGIYMERSAEMLVALLGILKAGGAYVPLDPGYPRDRVAFMIENSGLRVLVTQPRLEPALPAGTAEVLPLDPEFESVARERNSRIETGVTPENLAYVMYTSGSTGQPKGVMIAHRNVVNFFAGMDDRVDLDGDQPGVWYAVTSISFDISVLELFWTLARGFKVVLQSDREVEGPAETRPSRPVDFSLFYFASDQGESGSEKYRLLTEGARFADQHDFSAVWTPERHFHAFGGIYPSPSVMGSAIAAITDRVQIRAGSVVAPLHNPIRIAEEWSVVDNLSDGRVGIAIASGWQTNDFVLAPDNYENRKEIAFDSIETLRRLWRGEAVTFPSSGGRQVEVKTLPRPVQSELPVWVTAGGSPETFRRAGEVGAHLLTHLLGQSIEQLARKIEIYRQAFREHHPESGNGYVTIMLHTLVGDDFEVVRETVRAPFSNYLRTAIDLVKIAPKAFPNFSRVSSAETIADEDLTAEAFTEEDVDALVDHAFDRYFETSGLFGTPESCAAMVDRLRAIGIDEIACLIDFGVEVETVLASLQHLNQLRMNTERSMAPPHRETSLAEQFKRHSVTHMQCTPSMAKTLLLDSDSKDCLDQLHTLLIGGEPLPASLAREISEQVDQLVNMYGPTETTIWSTTSSVPADFDKITIGRPIANTQIYILDEARQPVPVGVAGEVYIGGDGVARGYLNRPDLSAERFLEDPFREDPEAVMYRTGDEARYKSDGTIEFIGRLDNQVKVRGYRIELGEIETALGKVGGVRDAVVLAREDTPGDRRLVAYVTTRNGEKLSTDRVRLSLKSTLPDFMLPSTVVVMQDFPLTPNGKVDRKALPAPDTDRPDLASVFVEPRNQREELLARIWSQVLGVENVGIHDNFFDLGGDSILAVQIVARAGQSDLQVTVRQLFNNQTVAELAEVATLGSAAAVDQSPVTGPVVLTPIQRWLLDQELPDLHHYNQTMLLMVPAATDSTILSRALQALVDHHDALRMRFRHTTHWEQSNAGLGAERVFERVDLSRVPEIDRDSRLAAIVDEAQASLDIENGPILRGIHFAYGDERPGRLLLVCHHLVIDGVSWRFLLEDLRTAFHQVAAGESVDLPAKTTSFKDWASKLAIYAKTHRGTLGEEYWLDTLDPDVPTLEADKPDGLNSEESTRVITRELSSNETADLLQRVPRVYNTQINDVLLSAFLVGFWKTTGNPRLLLDLEGHGREEILAGVDISRTVGWFTSLFPVVLGSETSWLQGSNWGAVLKSIKEQLRKIPGNGIGYGIARYLGDKSSPSRWRNSHPKATIQFNYLGQFDNQAPPDSLFATAPEPPGAFARIASPRQPRPYLLEVQGLITDDRLRFTWLYSENLHEIGTIEALANRYMEALRAIIAHCVSKKQREFTPGDFPLANLDQSKLDRLSQVLKQREQSTDRAPSS